MPTVSSNGVGKSRGTFCPITGNEEVLTGVVVLTGIGVKSKAVPDISKVEGIAGEVAITGMITSEKEVPNTLNEENPTGFVVKVPSKLFGVMICEDVVTVAVESETEFVVFEGISSVVWKDGITVSKIKFTGEEVSDTGFVSIVGIGEVVRKVGSTIAKLKATVEVDGVTIIPVIAFPIEKPVTEIDRANIMIMRLFL